MTEKRLHSSVSSHLDTDLAVLEAVIERSKFQHRSQPFLRRMREVLRLGSRVAALVNDCNTDNEAKASEVVVVIKFIQCLMKATVSIQQIIELEHFLPTVVSVIAIYGRLFALGSSIANTLGMEVEESLGVPKKKVREKRKRKELDEIVEVEEDYVYTPEPGRRVSTFDLGQKIERPVRSPSPHPVPRALAPVQVPTSSEESESPPPSSPDIPPSPVRVPSPPVEKPKKKKRMVDTETKGKKVKGKRKDDMDDIFGF